MSECKWEAPNGKKSELYDSVYQRYGDIPAQRVWAFARTPDFLRFFGDWQNKQGGGEVDSNGEPKVINDHFVNGLGDKLSVLAVTQNLDSLAQQRINIINRLSSLEARYEKTGRAGGLAQITSLKDEIASKPEEMGLSQVEKDKVALYRFIQFASKQSAAAYDKLLSLEAKIKDSNRSNEERKSDLRQLSQLAEYIEGFSFVKEVADSLEGFEYSSPEGNGIVDKAFQDKWIGPIMSSISLAQQKYTQLARPLVADFLLQYNTNAGLTKSQLIEMLTTMHEDVSIFERWGNSLADSGDQVLALINRAISDVRNTIHQDSFRFKQERLKPALEALEADATSRGIKADDYEKLYDFMLERDAKGSLTGKYKLVSPTATQAQKDFFKLYVNEYESSSRLLPAGQQRAGQLIPILKDSTERIFQDVNGVKSAASATGKVLANKFVRQSTDLNSTVEKAFDEEGNQFQFIPTRYTQFIGKDGDNISPKDVSLNLASNLGAFRHMAHNFKEMSKIVTELEATRDLVGSRRLELKEGDRTIVDRVTKATATREGVDTNAYKQLSDYLTMHVYGEMQADEGSFNFFGVEVDKAKLVSNIAGSTAFVQLGLNVYSALNNLTVGNYTNFMEGAGGQFYTASDILKAKKTYLGLVPDLLKDFSQRFPTSKLGVIMEELDIFQEEGPNGELLKEKSFLRRAGLGASMFLTKAGEHSIQSELFIGMANSHRVDGNKVLNYNDWVISNNKAFNNASKSEYEKLPTLWSAMSVGNGVLQSDVPKAEITKFAERVKGVYQRLHGNYAKRDTPALNRWGVGRLVGLFRKFLKPGWDRRWAKDEFNGSARFDQRLGANIGGNYTITYNFLKKVASDYKSLGKWVMSEEWDKLPEWKKQGIKRTAYEALAFAALATLIKGLDMLNDDDDDPSWLTTMGAYQAHRLSQEIGAFVNPLTAMDLLRSPAASMSMFQKAGRVASQLVPGAIGAFDEESGVGRYETGPHSGELKLPYYVKAIVPIYSQVERVFDPKAQLDWLTK